MYPYKTTAFIGVAYFGVILQVFRNKIDHPFQTDTELAKTLLRWCLFGTYLFYCLQSGEIDPLIAWKVYAYLSIPCLLLWEARESGKKITLWDWLALISLWIPHDLRPFGKRQANISEPLDYHVIELSALIISMVWWVWIRGLENEKITFPCRKTWKKDLLTTFHASAFLLVTLIPIGVATGFLIPKDFLQQTGLRPRLIGEILAHTLSYKFILGIIGYGMTVALVEEFWFRSMLQTFLRQCFRNERVVLLVSSLIFGLTHLNNDYPWNWKYVIMSAIAGFAYSWVYKNTSSIWYAVLLHATVDATSQTFFNRILMEAAK